MSKPLTLVITSLKIHFEFKWYHKIRCKSLTSNNKLYKNHYYELAFCLNKTHLEGHLYWRNPQLSQRTFTNAAVLSMKVLVKKDLTFLPKKWIIKEKWWMIEFASKRRKLRPLWMKLSHYRMYVSKNAILVTNLKRVWHDTTNSNI